MKVRTKIALLLLIVVATFAAGLVAMKMYERWKFDRIVAEREQERQKSFDSFMHGWTQSLEAWVNDSSLWDELVTALTTGDRAWGERNLGEGALATSRANALWLYTRDRKLFCSRNNLFSDALTTAPLPPEAMSAALDAGKLCHFFAETPLGLFEIRGATVHPSRDNQRSTPVQGYLLVGYFWSRESLKEISALTGHGVKIIPLTEPGEKVQDRRVGTVTFERELPGWDGRAIAKLLVRNNSTVLEQLHGSSERQFLWLILFAVVIFLLLVIFLTRWVNRPIRALSTCLRTESLEPIRGLQTDPCEFGDFARLIRDFFGQREALLKEMADRRDAQKALQDSEERLRHSQKMEAVGRLAGGIAHDFNNLLTAIIGYAELIARRTAPGQQNRDEAEQIAKAGEKAAALTRQLLAFSRKQILQPRVIDLNALLLDIRKLLQRVIGEHIDLRVDAAAPNPRVRADPNQIEQVVLNLGVNARDAMPGGGALTISTANVGSEGPIADETLALPAGNYVTLSVQDTGCGMDAATRERIFEPFFTTKGPGKGTGLGLATVYGIARQSGGGISVRSAPGAGTTFTVYLPLESAPLEEAKAPPVSHTRSHACETVLVVEDDQTVRELVCAVLSEQGYEVLCAGDCQDALRMAREHPGRIDLVVSDIVMPQMHGPELARELLRLRPRAKVLFVSGYSDADICNQGILAPDVRFLEKPFTPATLGRKVREVLDEKPAPAVRLSTAGV
jgi:signal transduction histidine kinase/ActR/RegA family two-component response regulator